MKKILSFLLALVLLGCAENPKEKATNSATSLGQLKWLVGDWQGKYNNAPFYESWRMVNDSLMLNFAIDISPTDTVLKENGFIQLTSNGIIHGGDKYTWTLDKLTDDEMVFVNDTVPYANRISWKHSPNYHWIADIKNKTGSIGYDLQRVNGLAPIVDGYMLAADKIPTAPIPN